jgi:pSer/pThr/pTyr-binding forkhead associated (FHA) protein
MIGTLLVIAGPDTNVQFPLEADQRLIIGRGADSATRLKDPQVSRKHCELRIEGTSVTIHDLDSAGGTLVNGRRVTSQRLKSGDVIQVGGTQLRLTLLDSSEPEASTLVLQPTKAADRQAEVEPLTELTGKKFSHYSIGPVIAKGTSGVVFRGQDEQSGQAVALKVLRPIYATDEDERQRFVRAMKTMLPLRHPNLVTLFAAGKQGQYC